MASGSCIVHPVHHVHHGLWTSVRAYIVFVVDGLETNPGLAGGIHDGDLDRARRHRAGDLDPPAGSGSGHEPLCSQTDQGSQYTPIRFSKRLVEAGIQPSVGAVGSSYDNALAESVSGLYKTELIRPRRPWRTIEEVELATADWVHWFNHRRLYEYCGDIPPVELETAYYARYRGAAAGCALRSESRGGQVPQRHRSRPQLPPDSFPTLTCRSRK
ncbi:MAG: putative transposase [Mycobacterium sp.]|nr:putative transposase [Mycobacterium sp.]